MNRSTYVEVNTVNIRKNLRTLINKYSDYKYHLAVVKADCYGHGIRSLIKKIGDEKIDYLVVATLEEALEIRKLKRNVPILCLGSVKRENIELCIIKNITISINSIDYLELIKNEELNGLKCHIKLNTGMNRLGIKYEDDFVEVYNILSLKGVEIEGIFTHIYDSKDVFFTNNQIERFIKLTNSIDLSSIKIVHIFASDAVFKYPKLNFVNGARFGINIYGLGEEELLSTFKVVSEVIQINNVKKNETVGYNARYKAKKDERIAVVAIGYADGITRKYSGQCVYINDKRYKIVGNICMDMLFVRVDSEVLVGDKVVVIKDNDHIREIANGLNTITYEIVCNISKRVPRVYV